MRLTTVVEEFNWRKGGEKCLLGRVHIVSAVLGLLDVL